MIKYDVRVYNLNGKSKTVWQHQGLVHREDGPAITFDDGKKEYWLNGVEVSEYQWKLQTKRVK